MTIFDTFLWAGPNVGQVAEPDLLRWRIEELRSVPDLVHVAVSGDRTFQGYLLPEQPKRLLRAFRKDRVRWYCAALPDQVPHPMDREIVQRNAILDAIPDAEPDDLVLVSDVDEIPYAEAVRWLDKEPGPALLWQRLHHGWINMRCQTEPWWRGTHAARRSWFRGINTPQRLRLMHNLPGYTIGGVHLSFLGGADAMAAKLAAWSHYEYSGPAYSSRENLEGALADVRDWEHTRRMRYALVPIDDLYPAYIREHQHEPEVSRYIRQPGTEEES